MPLLMQWKTTRKDNQEISSRHKNSHPFFFGLVCRSLLKENYMMKWLEFWPMVFQVLCLKRLKYFHETKGLEDDNTQHVSFALAVTGK